MPKRGDKDGVFKKLEGETFRFACHPGIECFTECCADLRLVLTPYDILRLKKGLGMTSEEFIEAHTVRDETDASPLPLLLLKMGDDPKKRCPFVSVEGCAVYEDRPGACRLYPVGRASSAGPAGGRDREFYFLVTEAHCAGFEKGREWTVEEWTSDQGVREYNEINKDWMEIVTNPLAGAGLGEDKIGMFYMASYNVEKFRRFVFETKFLKVFDVTPDMVRKIREDETALMHFGMRWIKFALFGEKTIRMK